MKKILLLGLQIFLSISLFAQAKSGLSLSGDFRTVSEFRQGYKSILPETAEPAFVVSQRSRLILDYKSDKFDLRFSAQDARAWGETFIVNSSKPILLHEAWVKYKFNNELNITLGRKSIKYGDNRIFADRNWSMPGASHDAAILNFSKKGLYIDFGLAFNNNSLATFVSTPYLINQYKSLSWLWASKTFSPKFKLNFINTLVGYEKTGTLTTYGLSTVGFNPVFKTHGFDFNSAAYFQFGKNESGNKHNAHIYTANLRYTYQFISLKAGYDHYSGKDYSDISGTDRHYIAIMGSISHAYLGFMDIMNCPQFQNQQGVSDLNFSLKYGKRTTITAYYHSLAYAKKPGADLSKKIGDEFDFLLTHKFDGNLTLNIGYSFMLPHDDFVTSSLGSGVSASFAQWAYVMVTFKPRLL